MEPQPPRLLTISQAAARLGVHPDSLRRWADKGLVAMLKLPSGYRRFEPQEIERVRSEMGLGDEHGRKHHMTERRSPLQISTDVIAEAVADLIDHQIEVALAPIIVRLDELERRLNQLPGSGGQHGNEAPRT